jgi:polyribonucleotide nucleotidyltransferase
MDIELRPKPCDDNSSSLFGGFPWADGDGAVCGACLQLTKASDVEMGSIDIKVQLFGTEEQVEKAKELIHERMAQWKGAVSQTASLAGAWSAAGTILKLMVVLLQPKASSDADSQETSFKIAVPAVMLAQLIGSGGSGVKEINSKSGASIKVRPWA